MTKLEFNELVYNYGASGENVTTVYNEEQKQIIALAWENSKDEEDPGKSDEIINSYYKDFIDNGDTIPAGYGYHKSNGRPKIDTEARRKTVSISGTPIEIEALKKLAEAKNKTLSRFVIDSLLN